VRSKPSYEIGLPVAQRCLMLTAAIVAVVIIAQINAAPTTAAINAGRLLTSTGLLR
jgi:hypothetical protein